MKVDPQERALFTGGINYKLGLALFMVALVTYAGTVGFGYSWDDPYLVGRVKQAISHGDIWGLFTHGFHVKAVNSARYYRPVMFASLLGEAVLTGGKPWFSHLVNVLIHALNAALLFVLFKRMLKENRGALIGALLFAVHPAHSGTVAGVSNRMELLSLALILPLLVYWTGIEDNDRRHGIRSAVLPLSFYFLACLTKEIAFMVPAVLLGWEALNLRRPNRHRLVVIVMTGVALGATILIRTIVFAREAAGHVSPTVQAGTFSSHISITQLLEILMVNVRMVILPFPGRTHWAATDFHPGWLSGLAVILFFLLLLFGFRRNPGITSRALIWWSVFTLPVSGLFFLGPMIAAERFTYIPSVGLCLLVGGIVASLPERREGRHRAAILAFTVLFLLGAASAAKARFWRDETALFTEVIRTNPGFATGYLNLGAVLARRGDFDEALSVYNRAQAHVQEPGDIIFNRGNLLYRLGRYREALADYDTVLEINPKDWEAYLNRGNVLLAMGNSEEAARSYRDAMVADGKSGKPLAALGALAARNRDFEKAVRLFKESVTRQPDLAEGFEGLGRSYMALGMDRLAQKSFFKVLEISPGNTRVALSLGQSLLETGHPVQAQYAFRTALAADRSILGAWIGLVRSFDAAGQGALADEAVKNLGALDPVLAEKVEESRKGGSGPTNP